MSTEKRIDVDQMKIVALIGMGGCLMEVKEVRKQNRHGR